MNSKKISWGDVEKLKMVAVLGFIGAFLALVIPIEEWIETTGTWVFDVSLYGTDVAFNERQSLFIAILLSMMVVMADALSDAIYHLLMDVAPERLKNAISDSTKKGVLAIIKVTVVPIFLFLFTAGMIRFQVELHGGSFEMNRSNLMNLTAIISPHKVVLSTIAGATGYYLGEVANS
ncbi:hypothetical protein [Haloarcula argentinensis]|uniref:Uncharacterized protein n=1 Tax=Haloarcula argentinensis TaxID=43776 RepID=A0A830FQM7_HALAR|nr:hypothetical protein [Haloarcula argentinensis]EMA23454.1 hypothetical protein C443_07318 [Haloarcula argentinensis DSM 12282]MDS0252941.1 hypothetical protein [Haloarcula argentinensis]GGM28284.1 hypothetical protein GCM10009006_07290 [Haloarcula argentinensis]